MLSTAARRFAFVFYCCIVAASCSDGTTSSNGDGGAFQDGGLAFSDSVFPVVDAVLPTDDSTVVNTCDDGKQNHDETDIDCGGSCDACAFGQNCKLSSDCATNACNQATAQCFYEKSCAQLYAKHGNDTDGEYVIDPDGPGTGSIAPFTVRCDMTIDGGGWTLVGKGREGWDWDNNGSGLSADLLKYNESEVAYLSSAIVRAIAGGKAWDNWENGLRINRSDGISDRWFVTPKTAGQTPFAWSLFLENSTIPTCVTTGTTHKTLAHWKQVKGEAITYQEGYIADSWRKLHDEGDDAPDNCDRVFTWQANGSHNCVAGWSSGYTCVPPEGSDCWVANTESPSYCIPHTTVWVKNCPDCPHIYYDAKDTRSYPDTGGDIVFDISGVGPQVNGNLISTFLKTDTLDGVKTFVFEGKAESRIQFANKTLNPFALTAIFWVYSQNSIDGSASNDGGLYVNTNTAATDNPGDYIWFGKWHDSTYETPKDRLYFRVNNADEKPFQDIHLAAEHPVSGFEDIPQEQWVMIHLAYQTAATNGWIWGVNGENVETATIPDRPYTQTATYSTIGYGHAPSSSREDETGGAYWKGGISSIKFYNRLLSTEEIRNEYNATKAIYGH